MKKSHQILTHPFSFSFRLELALSYLFHHCLHHCLNLSCLILPYPFCPLSSCPLSWSLPSSLLAFHCRHYHRYRHCLRLRHRHHCHLHRCRHRYQILSSFSCLTHLLVDSFCTLRAGPGNDSHRHRPFRGTS